MDLLKSKAAAVFLYGMDWYVYTRSVLGLDTVNHDYHIVATGKKMMLTYVKYKYLDRDYIVIDRQQNEINKIFPIYPPLQEDLDANIPVIVTDDNGEDITDKVLMFAGPKGDFYQGTPYYVRLRNVSSVPITIMDSNMEELEFKNPCSILKLN